MFSYDHLPRCIFILVGNKILSRCLLFCYSFVVLYFSPVFHLNSGLSCLISIFLLRVLFKRDWDEKLKLSLCSWCYHGKVYSSFLMRPLKHKSCPARVTWVLPGQPDHSSKLLGLWAFNHSMHLNWILDNQLKTVGRFVIQQWKGVAVQLYTEHTRIWKLDQFLWIFWIRSHARISVPVNKTFQVSMSVSSYHLIVSFLIFGFSGTKTVRKKFLKLPEVVPKQLHMTTESYLFS